MMTKEELRVQAKALRAELGKNRKKEWDFAIAKSIAASAEFRRAKKLFLYAPANGEIDLLPLVKKARTEGKEVAFPRCDVATGEMQFFALKPEQRLVPGAYGIFEPPAEAELSLPDERTLCILPGLTFDEKGNRLGYGKGYYDRYLQNGFPGITAGAVYEDFLVKELPAESTDVPVQILFTDRRRLGKEEEIFRLPEWAKKATPYVEKAKETGNSLLAWAQKEAAEPYGSRNFRPVTAPPVMVFLLFLLLGIVGIVNSFLPDLAAQILLLPFQAIVFCTPVALYYFSGGTAVFKKLRIRKIKLSNLWFLFCVLIVMIFGGLLFSILTGGISSLNRGFVLYSTFASSVKGNFFSVLFAILGYALVPAVLEEVFFRGILCPMYERFGTGIPIFVSGLFFAMMHFDLQNFLTYLLMGILLAALLYVTGSLVAPICLHFLYNLFCLFGQPLLSDFYVNAGNTAVFIFLVTVIFLLFACFALGAARKIYHRYAKEGRGAGFENPLPWKEYPKAIQKVLFTPGTAGCLLIWLIACIVNLT